MKIKVGDRVKLRDGSEDLIVAEVRVKSLDGYDFSLTSTDFEDDFDENFDEESQPFISKKGTTYSEDGSYYSDDSESDEDIVEIIKEKIKVKRYRWVYNNLLSDNCLITDNSYSEKEIKHSVLGRNFQKIESTMKEIEVDA